MRLFSTVAGLRCYLNRATTGQIGNGGSSVVQLDAAPRPVAVGLVPTMGALHAGHLSLIHQARQDNDLVVVSIFVNPLQFGENEDFQQYPRSLDADRALCEQMDVDVVFAPTALELYGTEHLAPKAAMTQVIPPLEMMTYLCGRSRPGHFQGVATVVTKLLNLVQPHRAYFGQKDAQQLAIIRRLVQDLNIPVEIIGCPIVRESNGLALSSRNRYLTPAQRSHAVMLSRSLTCAEQAFHQGKTSSDDLIAIAKAALATVPNIQLEYLELVHPQTIMPLDQVNDVGLLAIAAHIGSTRLIDNIVLQNRKPIVAIDGPAGVGKSTVVRQVAQQLGLMYLDTGAMYRAVTWLVLQSGIAVDDDAAIAELVTQCQIELENEISGKSDSDRAYPPKPIPQVWINGQDVTTAIRTQEVTANVSAIAAQSTVRHELVRQQQSIGKKGGIVMDGRDIGTFVFPDAELKIFLTASVAERARRRQLDLKNQGQPDVSLEELEQTIFERDRKDSTRALAPLRKATDAIEINTDNLAADQVVAKIVGLYRDRFR